MSKAPMTPVQHTGEHVPRGRSPQPWTKEPPRHDHHAARRKMQLWRVREQAPTATESWAGFGAAGSCDGSNTRVRMDIPVFNRNICFSAIAAASGGLLLRTYVGMDDKAEAARPSLLRAKRVTGLSHLFDAVD